MEKYIFDESNGLLYELQGNYYIPYLTVYYGENCSTIDLARYTSVIGFHCISKLYSFIIYRKII